MIRHYALLLLLLTANTSNAMNTTEADSTQIQQSKFDSLLEAYLNSEDPTEAINNLEFYFKLIDIDFYNSINAHAYAPFYLTCLWNTRYAKSKKQNAENIEDHLIIAALYIAETKEHNKYSARTIINELLADTRTTENTQLALLRAQGRLNR